MTDFVLVHGSFSGGWCWDRLVPFLEREGDRVVAPSMTGPGEVPGGAGSVGLDTHVDDVVAAIERAGLDDVVLVGHSYGGPVISGVAAAIAARVGHVVYLDAYVPATGESCFDQALPWVRDAYAERATDGLVSFDARMLGIEGDAEIAWFDAHTRPWNARSHDDPAAGPPADLPKTYVVCTGADFFVSIAERLRAQGWPVVELATAHWPMITHPEELAELLRSVARQTHSAERGA